MKKSICVYCGASTGNDPKFMNWGRELGQYIAKEGWRLVYGAGTRGVMGAVSAGALEADGEVLGIIPDFLIKREALEEELKVLTELRVTQNMHERKWAMFEESDVFVALPGGIGTLEELVEIMTWAQLGRHEKPIIVANFDGYWEPFLSLLQKMRESGFIHHDDLLRIVVIEEPAALMDAVGEAMG